MPGINETTQIPYMDYPSGVAGWIGWFALLGFSLVGMASQEKSSSFSEVSLANPVYRFSCYSYNYNSIKDL